MSNELLRDIAELRRNMPRNATAMRVCDALEARLTETSMPQKYEHREIGYAFVDMPDGNVVGNFYQGKFDKKAYQRGYMRKRRAAEKANAGV